MKKECKVICSRANHSKICEKVKCPARKPHYKSNCGCWVDCIAVWNHEAREVPVRCIKVKQ